MVGTLSLCPPYEAVNAARCHRPRRRAIQYAETIVIKDRWRGVLDAPLSRGMTIEF